MVRNYAPEPVDRETLVRDKLQDGKEIEWPVPYWHLDAGAALMLILLAAIDEGLAAGVYVGRPLDELVRWERWSS
jgi:hypothetical protein